MTFKEYMKPKQIKKMKIQSVKDYLKDLMDKLDELDEMDFFGTEGWRKFIMDEED